MWGSYVIFVIIILIIILTSATTCMDLTFTQKFSEYFAFGGSSCRGIGFTLSGILALPMILIIPLVLLLSFTGTQTMAVSFIIYAIIGFLIGWRIHSLVRRLKKIKWLKFQK